MRIEKSAKKLSVRFSVLPREIYKLLKQFSVSSISRDIFDDLKIKLN